MFGFLPCFVACHALNTKLDEVAKPEDIRPCDNQNAMRTAFHEIRNDGNGKASSPGLAE